VILFCALAAGLPAPAFAQAAAPADLARVEEARTRRCVPAIARSAEIQEQLAPLFRRADRIQMLHAAVTLEDSARVTPLDADDPVEAAVRDWFATDEALALQFVETGDESIQERRAAAKERLRERLQGALDPLREQTEARLAEDGAVVTAATECEDVFLVRSAALAACETSGGPVCEDVRAAEPRGRFAFVDAAEDLWEVEQIRPWSEPTALYQTPDGGLAGARSVAITRRGNLILAVGLEPMIRERATLSEDELAEMEASLDSLGFEFEHPRYAMTPVMTIQMSVDAPLGGETDYVLHFGNLSDPVNDIIWTAPAAAQGPVRAVVPVEGWVLNALATGDPVTLTALRRDDAEPTQVVFALALAPVGQSAAVGGLLSYIGSGQLASDLSALLPPDVPNSP
jgi:hypothetical protein